MRNVLPIYPLVLLIAAAGIVALADLIPRRALRWGALALLTLALLAPQVDGTVWLLRYWSRPYTMAAAAANWDGGRTSGGRVTSVSEGGGVTTSEQIFVHRRVLRVR